MRLTFIGSGSAFTVSGNFHSNMLLEADNGQKLLIDCGSDARHALARLKMSHLDINDVYISHLHADHAGGLEWLAFTTKFDKRCQKKPGLYIHQDLVKPIWHILGGGLESIENEKTTLTTYFDVKALKSSFEWNGARIDLVPTHHIHNGTAWWSSYGVFIDIGGKKLFITTDTQFFPDLYEAQYRQADVIFHDCETAVPASGVHPSYANLKTLPSSIKGKMWLYHYNDGALPDAQADGFLGFVQKGQSFDLR